MQIKPILDNILVEKAPIEEKTASGIILPGAKKNTSTNGFVFAVGGGRYSVDGTLIPMSVKPGDNVIFSELAGYDLDVGENLMILKESEILGIIS